MRVLLRSSLVVLSFMVFSAFSTATFAASPPTIPSFSPSPGTTISTVTVTLSTTTPGSSLHYTTDGSTPTSGSTLYSAPLTFTQTTTLKAIASKDGIDSSVTSGTYTIQVAEPTLSPATGTYTSSTTVTMSCATPGASIYYTTDGTAPTASSILYAGPVSVTQTTMLRARGIKTGLQRSTVKNETYTIVVATPTITPNGGAITATQSIALATATTGATIRYTTDGSTPTGSSAEYVAPFTLGVSATVKAIALKSGCTNSGVASAAFILPVSDPVFSPSAPGTHEGFVSVTMSTTTPGASIYYTTNGAAPTTSSTLYSGAVTLTSTTTLKAIGMKVGSTNSAVVTGTYTISPLVPPTMDPVAGTYISSVTVTLATASTIPGAQIRYTTNGTTPSAASTLYSGPFTLTTSQTVKARTFASPATPSTTTSSAYVIQAATPTFSPTPGTFEGSVLVTLACSTPGSTIRYTRDGSTPTASSTLYTAPLLLSNTPAKPSPVIYIVTTIKAQCFKAGVLPSAVATGTYTVTPLNAPTISPLTGTYIDYVTVTISTGAVGIIRYTLNGTVPTLASTVYTGPFTLYTTPGTKGKGAEPATYNVRAKIFFPDGSSYEIGGVNYLVVPGSSSPSEN